MVDKVCEFVVEDSLLRLILVMRLIRQKSAALRKDELQMLASISNWVSTLSSSVTTAICNSNDIDERLQKAKTFSE